MNQIFTAITDLIFIPTDLQSSIITVSFWIPHPSISVRVHLSLAGVCLACSGHAVDPGQRSQGIGTSAPITLEENVWIGANATVCGGVTIGADSVIGAGSVVTHDIPAGVIAAGVPCRVIRPITEKDKIRPEDILF